MFFRILRKVVLLGALIILLAIPRATLQATEDVYAVVKTAVGADVAQLSLDYQMTLLESIPELSIYRFMGHDAQLIANLGADARVEYARMETDLESRPNFVDASGSDLSASVRYLDASVRYLDASVRDLEPNVEFLEASVRYLDASNAYINAQVRYLDASVRYLDASVRYLDASVFYVDEEGNLLADPYRGQPGAYTVRFDPAHDLATGEGVIVAVLDSGIDPEHPLLEDNVIPGYDFVDNDDDPREETDGLDNDNDGHVDEAYGHGTHVAGIVNLASPSVKIMPLRIFDTDGHGTYFNAAAAIVYAVDAGAQVINLSGNGDEDSPLLKDAIDYAWQHDAVIIAAAGVDELRYPGLYPNVISVGAVDENDYRAAFARYIGQSPTVFAPGTDIFSAYVGGHVATWTGNSMASPFVAGEVALMLSTGMCDRDCAFAAVSASGQPVADDNANRIDAFDAVAMVANQPQTRLRVQYHANVNDGPSDPNIQPHFKIVNQGNSMHLDEFTLRYWFESQAPAHTFHCDYAFMGCDQIAADFGQTTEGDKYAQIHFNNSGMLFGGIGGHDTGAIEVRINASNWQPFNENLHYSFAANPNYIDWDKVTIYHQGQLIWGVEPNGQTADMSWYTSPNTNPAPPAPPNSNPPVITPTLSLQYFTYGKTAVANYINPMLQLVNGGSAAVPLQNVTIRYWFPDAPNAFAACDYAVINCSNITVAPGPNYFDVKFGANAGPLAANSVTGQMQLRFHKNDWSNFNQAAHYSYNPAFNGFTNWENITVYYNNVLAWGIEPQ